jgi:Co/Zn/Cd efflux system component
MRSVWICSRNDAVGNVAVMLAALGVLGTGTAWPDLCVAAAMGHMALTGAWTVVCHARAELRTALASAAQPAPPAQPIAVTVPIRMTRRR